MESFKTSKIVKEFTLQYEKNMAVGYAILRVLTAPKTKYSNFSTEVCSPRNDTRLTDNMRASRPAYSKLSIFRWLMICFMISVLGNGSLVCRKTLRQF